MRFVRMPVGLLVIAVVLLLSATPGLARAQLVDSDPADRASLDAVPDRVTLVFDRPVTASPVTGTAVRILDPDRRELTVRAAEIDGVRLSAAVDTGGPAGLYTLSYTVTAEGGQPLTGSLHFSVTGSGGSGAAAAGDRTDGVTGGVADSVADSVTGSASGEEAGVPVSPAPAAGAPTPPVTDRSSTGWAWAAAGLLALAAAGIARLRLGARGGRHQRRHRPPTMSRVRPHG